MKTITMPSAEDVERINNVIGSLKALAELIETTGKQVQSLIGLLVEDEKFWYKFAHEYTQDAELANMTREHIELIEAQEDIGQDVIDFGTEVMKYVEFFKEYEYKA